MSLDADVIIVGAGAMGSAAARSLAEAGREVLILERYGLGHDRGGSHGASRLFRIDYSSTESLAAALQSHRLWRELEEAGGERLLTTVGGIEYGARPEYADEVEARCAAAGVSVERLDQASAAERWPQFRFPGEVIFQPDGGCLNADRSVAVLQKLARDAGAEFSDHRPVEAIRVIEPGDGDGGGLVEVRVADATLRARQVVLAAGSWAPRLVPDLIKLPKLIITQEQPRFFEPRDHDQAWPVFVHWRSGVGPYGNLESYGVAEPGRGVKVGLHASGPVIDPDRRDFSPEPEADRALIDYVREWMPGLDPEVSTPISCLYDTTPDQGFIIDRAGPITVATGFCGTGFKFVPLIGQLIRDLVAGTASAPPAFRLSSGRFGSR